MWIRRNGQLVSSDEGDIARFIRRANALARISDEVLDPVDPGDPDPGDPDPPTGNRLSEYDVLVGVDGATLYPGAGTAFPSAEGFGRNTTGGRGGTIRFITNTNDSGAGSAREAFTATGSRYIIPLVWGYVHLNSGIETSNGNFTYFGQFMPDGQGLILRDADNDSVLHLDAGANNCILRYVKCYKGNPVAEPIAGGGDSLGTLDMSQAIISNSTFAFGMDETFNVWSSDTITLQDSYVLESIHDGSHSEGNHGKGTFFGGNRSNNVTCLRVFTAYHNDRVPFLKLDGEGTREPGEVVNCYTFNCGQRIQWTPETSSTSDFDIIKNYVQAGPATQHTTEWGRSNLGSDGVTNRAYLEGNVGPGRPTDTGDQWAGVNVDGGEVKLASRVVTEHNIREVSATQAKEDILNWGGASYVMRQTAGSDTFTMTDVRDDLMLDNIEYARGTKTPPSGWHSSQFGDAGVDTFTFPTIPSGSITEAAFWSDYYNPVATAMGWPLNQAGAESIDPATSKAYIELFMLKWVPDLPNWDTDISPGGPAPLAFYVDAAQGNDSNSGTSDAPLRSLNEAGLRLAALPLAERAGYHVYLRGTITEYNHGGSPSSPNGRNTSFPYNASSWNFDGVEGDPIVIETDPTEVNQAILDGSSVPQDYSNRSTAGGPILLNIEGDNIVVKNVKVQNSAGAGIIFGGGWRSANAAIHNCGLENVEVMFNHGDGVFFSSDDAQGAGTPQSTGCYAIDSSFHHNQDHFNNGNSASGLKIGSHANFTITNCDAYKNSDDGFDFFASSNVVISGLSRAWSNGYYSNTETSSSYTLYGESDLVDAPDGNGNGFKLGGNNDSFDNIAHHCLAWKNKVVGFTHNTLQNGFVYNCTGWDNGNQDFALRDGTTVVGCVYLTGGLLLDNGFGDWAPNEYNAWGDGSTAGNPFSNNNFNLTITSADFLSLDPSSADFLVPAPASELSDPANVVPSSFTIAHPEGHNVTEADMPGLTPTLGAHDVS